MNLKEIKEMIQLMQDNNLTELEIEKDGLKVRLKKGASGSIEPYFSQETRSSSGQRNSQVREVPEPKEAPVKPAPNPKNIIKSPMVGTFYASPAPDASAFVQPGSAIEIGQVVCIIEAMKLMNEIKAEIRGKVVEILVNNGDPVEFGQPLFIVE